MVMQYCKSLVEVRLGGSTNNILEKVVGRGNLVRSSLFFCIRIRLPPPPQLLYFGVIEWLCI